MFITAGILLPTRLTLSPVAKCQILQTLNPLTVINMRLGTNLNVETKGTQSDWFSNSSWKGCVATLLLILLIEQVTKTSSHIWFNLILSQFLIQSDGALELTIKLVIFMFEHFSNINCVCETGIIMYVNFKKQW